MLINALLACSWIPITVWIVLRNITPTLRTVNLGLYGWLGCITLETYVSQFHTWLSTGIPNGQPKMLLMLFPAGYPLLNFAATTAGNSSADPCKALAVARQLIVLEELLSPGVDIKRNVY